jgi:diacylglycerol kinase family enzyme
MDKAKRTTEVFRDENEQPATPPATNEVRTLSELELVLCGGGDGIIHWPG